MNFIALIDGALGASGAKFIFSAVDLATTKREKERIKELLRLEKIWIHIDDFSFSSYVTQSIRVFLIFIDKFFGNPGFNARFILSMLFMSCLFSGGVVFDAFYKIFHGKPVFWRVMAMLGEVIGPLIIVNFALDITFFVLWAAVMVRISMAPTRARVFAGVLLLILSAYLVYSFSVLINSGLFVINKMKGFPFSLDVWKIFIEITWSWAPQTFAHPWGGLLAPGAVTGATFGIGALMSIALCAAVLLQAVIASLFLSPRFNEFSIASRIVVNSLSDEKNFFRTVGWVASGIFGVFVWFLKT
ncbi:hypothetical protein [Paraburkholderia bannensis]|uniref:hypothetical protein n=1 Tax=Paraburkholderia bannensis TaxID=765414 RepID=UPI002AB782CD|nr:hypothetical protein [Paraburkholderia bannensis]